MPRDPLQLPASAHGGMSTTTDRVAIPDRLAWMRRAASKATPGEVGSLSEGHPPQGYMLLWMGNFRRWQRRFFVASEAPGVVLIYKRSNRKGKVRACP